MSGAEYDNKTEYEGIRQKYVPTIEKKGARDNGVTIGKEKRGVREGCPTIADKVWIGANAVVVGSIQIGSDVLIAPGAYVNFDVPSHSIVLGNPAKIVAKENATEKYIKYTI